MQASDLEAAILILLPYNELRTMCGVLLSGREDD